MKKKQVIPVGESKLLFDEEPLLIPPQLAKKIGLNEAIVLQQIHYWVKKNEKENKGFRDGYYWTFNPYNKWQKQFPFWSVRTIQRTIRKLEKMGLIVSANYNHLSIDRTKWYRIDYEVLEILEKSPFGHIDATNMAKWHEHLAKKGRPIPETNIQRKRKENNKYIALPGDIRFIAIYLDAYRRYIGTDHPPVRKSQLEEIIETVQRIEENGISEEEWREDAELHFQNLPPSNDGKIFAFLAIWRKMLHL